MESAGGEGKWKEKNVDSEQKNPGMTDHVSN